MGKKMNLRDLGSADVQKQSDAELDKWTADGRGRCLPTRPIWPKRTPKPDGRLAHTGHEVAALSSAALETVVG